MLGEIELLTGLYFSLNPPPADSSACLSFLVVVCRFVGAANGVCTIMFYRWRGGMI